MKSYTNIERLKKAYLHTLPEMEPEEWPRVRRAIQCIHTNLFALYLTVTWMRKQCQLNDHNFSALFARCTGKTPKQYILYHRIKVAKKLLSIPQLSDVPLSVIAFELGFTSSAAFSMFFKRKTGETPGQWRQNHG